MAAEKAEAKRRLPDSNDEDAGGGANAPSKRSKGEPYSRTPSHYAAGRYPFLGGPPFLPAISATNVNVQ